ncbi:MAG: hypothetical protein NTW25_06600 [Candidatus Kapabacteria bacterium]|nr:hypothetical protein [Candidatus Kapabacteria bacterium]
METKRFDCIEMQREIRNELLEEANFDLHTLIEKVKENNKVSRFYKLLTEKKSKELELI